MLLKVDIHILLTLSHSHMSFQVIDRTKVERYAMPRWIQWLDMGSGIFDFDNRGIAHSMNELIVSQLND